MYSIFLVCSQYMQGPCEPTLSIGFLKNPAVIQMWQERRWLVRIKYIIKYILATCVNHCQCKCILTIFAVPAKMLSIKIPQSITRCSLEIVAPKATSCVVENAVSCCGDHVRGVAVAQWLWTGLQLYMTTDRTYTGGIICIKIISISHF